MKKKSFKDYSGVNLGVAVVILIIIVMTSKGVVDLLEILPMWAQWIAVGLVLTVAACMGIRNDNIKHEIEEEEVYQEKKQQKTFKEQFGIHPVIAFLLAIVILISAWWFSGVFFTGVEQVVHYIYNLLK